MPTNKAFCLTLSFQSVHNAVLPLIRSRRKKSFVRCKRFSFAENFIKNFVTNFVRQKPEQLNRRFVWALCIELSSLSRFNSLFRNCFAIWKFESVFYPEEISSDLPLVSYQSLWGELKIQNSVTEFPFNVETDFKVLSFSLSASFYVHQRRMRPLNSPALLRWFSMEIFHWETMFKT